MLITNQLLIFLQWDMIFLHSNFMLWATSYVPMSLKVHASYGHNKKFSCRSWEYMSSFFTTWSFQVNKSSCFIVKQSTITGNKLHVFYVLCPGRTNHQVNRSPSYLQRKPWTQGSSSSKMMLNRSHQSARKKQPLISKKCFIVNIA